MGDRNSINLKLFVNDSYSNENKMSPKSRGWATREEALDAAKKAVDELNKRLDVEERTESLMKKLTVFLLVFIPIFLIVYGTVSKVVISGRTEQIKQGQEALRQNKSGNFTGN